MQNDTPESSDEFIIQQLLKRPGFMMRRGFHEVRNYFETACAETGLTSQQYDVLFVLSFVSHMPQTRLGQLLNFDKSTTTLIVRKLEEKGYLERKTLSSDTRQRLVRLTPEGRKVFDRSQDAARGSQKVVRDILGEEDYAQLLQLLARLVNGLDYHRSLPGNLWDAE